MSSRQVNFINGAPMRDPSYFIGPIAWWSDSLKCGGVERQLIANAQAFKEQGIPITLLCRTMSQQGGNNYFQEESRICCKQISSFSSDMVDSKFFAAARNIVNSVLKGGSLVFQNSIAAYAAWLLRVHPKLLHIWNADHLAPLLAAIIAGVPKIIIGGQSLSPAQRAPYGFESVDDNLAFAVLSNVLRMPDVIMTNNTRAGCITYEEWLGLPPGTIALTPNIFDLNKWPCPDVTRAKTLRESFGMPKNAHVLGGLFRFVSSKDPELWVSTAVRACAANTNLFAIIGGHGPELDHIQKRIARTPFATRILFPGPIRDVPAFMSMCSVFLHTAYVEGLPNVLLEAQASEVPVVTTSCGGAPDVVDHGKSGFVVEERDDAVLACYIGLLLKNSQFAKEAGRIGRARIASDFSPKISISNQLKVYEKLLPNANGLGSGTKKKNDYIPRIPIETANNTWPLVSIVLPTYNHLDFLPQAIDSILSQDYHNFELIIVDDGSTDGTANYLKNLSSPKIRVIGGANTRLPTALNRGFALARGDYLTWTSADNICLPHFCTTLVKAMQTYPQAGLASASFARINSEGIVIDRLAGKVSLDSILCHNTGVAAFMYRKDIAHIIGDYNANLEGAEDWDMWLRMLEKAPPVNVPQVLYQYRWHENSMTFKLSDKVRESSTRTAFRALKRLKMRGDVRALYPQIEQCRDIELALFHANLILGTKMIEHASFLKGAAAEYLETAYSLRPDNIVAMGNYALALTWHGRWDEALRLIQKGTEREPQIFSSLQDCCSRQRRHAGRHEFYCQPLPCPEPEESELIRRVAATQLIFSNSPRRDYAF